MIKVITLDNPPVNALSFAYSAKLLEQVQAAEADASVEAVIFTGANDIFSAGADINDFLNEPSPETKTVRDVINAIEHGKKIYIVAIDGNAMGGGLELALACDYRVATERSKVGLPEIKLGLLPGAGGTQRLTRLVGPGRATELIMKGLQLSPEQAAEAGLVHFLVEPAELEEKARDYTVRLARQAPIALRGIKRAIRSAWSPDGLAVEADAFREVLASEDAQTGVKAFLEGERASFTGT